MSEIEALKAEVAKLREEVARLSAGQVMHHYHHQAQPAPFVGSPTVMPQYPWAPGYTPATCGSAFGDSGNKVFAWNGADGTHQ